MSYESQPASSFAGAAGILRRRVRNQKQADERSGKHTKRNHGGLPLLNRNPIEFSRLL